ncbi:hypothetical protein [Streptomyces sp. NPDC058486]|uniref:hypothetical protein n=1 Tax=Streptomyces sp. NPDC058486 TaxID=3346526 RepID=UPI00364C293C
MLQGEKAVALLRRAHDDAVRLRPETSPHRAAIFDETMAQELLARRDLAEALGRTGDSARRVDVLLEGRGRADFGEPGPRTRRALGRLHHNLSVAEAEEIRQKHADVDNPLTLKEWASSTLHYARCLIYAQDPEGAAKMLNQSGLSISMLSGTWREQLPAERRLVGEMLVGMYSRYRTTHEPLIHEPMDRRAIPNTPPGLRSSDPTLLEADRPGVPHHTVEAHQDRDLRDGGGGVGQTQG